MRAFRETAARAAARRLLRDGRLPGLPRDGGRRAEPARLHDAGRSAGCRCATQVALAGFGRRRSAAPAGAPRVIAPDVLVIGGGAGGLIAAIAARGAGGVGRGARRTQGGAAGSTTSRRRSAPVLDAQQAEGAALVARAVASGAEIVGRARRSGAPSTARWCWPNVRAAALIARPRHADRRDRRLRAPRHGARAGRCRA